MESRDENVNVRVIMIEEQRGINLVCWRVGSDVNVNRGLVFTCQCVYI